MRPLTMTMMALMAFAATVFTAQSESLGGALIPTEGQCFKYPGPATFSMDAKDGRFGSWGACAQPASKSKASAHHKARQHPAQPSAEALRPQPKPAGDPLYESCEFPWKHPDVSCPGVSGEGG